MTTLEISGHLIYRQYNKQMKKHSVWQELFAIQSVFLVLAAAGSGIGAMPFDSKRNFGTFRNPSENEERSLYFLK